MYKDIRNTFLDYFKKQGHEILPSSSIVPQSDKSLLFTNSGMVQFKDYFTGSQEAKYKKITTCQKSVRAGGKHNDLDNVGYTNRHHTFFEMLGNFSFGDYFKQEAIYFAWELLTKYYSIPKDKLFVTIYHDDEEASNLWKKIANISDDRIVRIKGSDNFWSMGDSGPCGPCSEIFYDLGDSSVLGGNHTGYVGQNDRYIEIWNLVFMQYEKLLSGDVTDLPKKSIDTGASVERLALVLEGKLDTYKTSLFAQLINEIENLYSHRSQNASCQDFETAYRVIADHIRCVCFLINDNVLPERDGRGYVLRRIMRRAMRYAYQLNPDNQMLYKLVNSVVNLMQDHYSELKVNQKLIEDVILEEEKLFAQTLSKGITILENNAKGEVLDGSVAFKLYDTYGFPLDLTESILREKNIKLDFDGFQMHMQAQQEKAKKSWQKALDYDQNIWKKIQQECKTNNLFYQNTSSCDAKIIAIVKDNKFVNKITKNETAFIVLDNNVFYPESGGQVGDKGRISNSDVINTRKFLDSIPALEVCANEDLVLGTTSLRTISFRKLAMSNHTATHLLQAALRIVLGVNVSQRGSFVDEELLRFDFSHRAAMSDDEITKVNNLVNFWIAEKLDVKSAILKKSEAEKLGALAFFEDKYGEEVRVISIGSCNISIELCGGTHVENTGQIEKFVITSESSIGSGIRRITALTGCLAKNFIQDTKKLKDEIVILKNKLTHKEKQLSDCYEKIPTLLNKMVRFENAILLYCEKYENIYLQKLLNVISRQNDKVVISINSHSDKVYFLCLKDRNSQRLKNFNCKDIMTFLSKFAQVRGGGDSYFYQLSINIEEYEKIPVQKLQELF
jgi:alanyl-tRNA synthetase